MSIRLGQILSEQSERLRYEPTAKRIRAFLGGNQLAVDSQNALLVWEPGQAIPTYAVPVGDLTVPLTGTGARKAALTGIPAQTTPGSQASLVGASGGQGTGLLPEDPDLSGFVILDFGSFERWLEEDDEIFGHPRDPFHRVDVRSTSRRIQVKWHGRVLTDTVRGKLVFETALRTRYYVPPEDMLVQLSPTATHTLCPYKGKASYWSFNVDGEPAEDLIWSYEDPLEDVAGLKGYLAFYDEKIDVLLDGEPVGTE